MKVNSLVFWLILFLVLFLPIVLAFYLHGTKLNIEDLIFKASLATISSVGLFLFNLFLAHKNRGYNRIVRCPIGHLGVNRIGLKWWTIMVVIAEIIGLAIAYHWLTPLLSFSLYFSFVATIVYWALVGYQTTFYGCEYSARLYLRRRKFSEAKVNAEIKRLYRLGWL